MKKRALNEQKQQEGEIESANKKELYRRGKEERRNELHLFKAIHCAFDKFDISASILWFVAWIAQRGRAYTHSHANIVSICYLVIVLTACKC